MEILSSDSNPKPVEDYIFVFTNGSPYPVTLDLSVGDTIEFTPEVVKIFLAPKPSLADPRHKMPGEDINIFVRHILYVQHRSRIQEPFTYEQWDEWTKTLRLAAGL